MLLRSLRRLSSYEDKTTKNINQGAFLVVDDRFFDRPLGRSSSSFARTAHSVHSFVSDTQLNKRLYPSVHWYVSPSVRQSVGEHKSKSGKISILEAFRVCVCVGTGVG